MDVFIKARAKQSNPYRSFLTFLGLILDIYITNCAHCVDKTHLQVKEGAYLKNVSTMWYWPILHLDMDVVTSQNLWRHRYSAVTWPLFSALRHIMWSNIWFVLCFRNITSHPPRNLTKIKWKFNEIFTSSYLALLPAVMVWWAQLMSTSSLGCER